MTSRKKIFFQISKDEVVQSASFHFSFYTRFKQSSALDMKLRRLFGCIVLISLACRAVSQCTLLDRQFPPACPDSALLSIEEDIDTLSYINATGQEEEFYQQIFTVTGQTGWCDSLDYDGTPNDYFLTFPIPWCQRVASFRSCLVERPTRFDPPSRAFNVRPLMSHCGDSADEFNYAEWDKGGFMKGTITVRYDDRCERQVPDPDNPGDTTTTSLGAFLFELYNGTIFPSGLHQEFLLNATSNDTGLTNPLIFGSPPVYVSSSVGDNCLAATLTGTCARCPGKCEAFPVITCNRTRPTDLDEFGNSLVQNTFTPVVELACRDVDFGLVWKVSNPDGPALHFDWQVLQNPNQSVYLPYTDVTLPESLPEIYWRNPYFAFPGDNGFWPNTTGKFTSETGHYFYIPTYFQNATGFNLYAGRPGHYVGDTTLGALVQFFDLTRLMNFTALQESAMVTFDLAAIEESVAFVNDTERQAVKFICSNPTQVPLYAFEATAGAQNWDDFCELVRNSVSYEWPEALNITIETFELQNNVTQDPLLLCNCSLEEIECGRPPEVAKYPSTPGYDPEQGFVDPDDGTGVSNSTNTTNGGNTTNSGNTTGTNTTNGGNNTQTNNTGSTPPTNTTTDKIGILFQYDYFNFPNFTIDIRVSPQCRMPLSDDPPLNVTNLVPATNLTTNSTPVLYEQLLYKDVLSLTTRWPDPRFFIINETTGLDIFNFTRSPFGVLWNISSVSRDPTATDATIRLEAGNYNNVTDEVYEITRPYVGGLEVNLPPQTTLFYLSRTLITQRIYGSGNFPCQTRGCQFGDPGLFNTDPQLIELFDQVTEPSTQFLDETLTQEEVDALPLCVCQDTAPCLEGRFIFGVQLDANLSDLAGAVVDIDVGGPFFPPGELPPEACVPTIEVCDGCDNDCDNIIDNNIFGASATCGVSTVGNCQLGTYQCDATPPPVGQKCVPQKLTCLGAVYPEREDCSGLDRDCDGVPDNPAILGRPCGSHIGICQQGTYQCVSGNNEPVCVGEVGPQPEICGDGLDNNCNGIIDDGCTDTTIQQPSPSTPQPTPPSPPMGSPTPFPTPSPVVPIPAPTSTPDPYTIPAFGGRLANFFNDFRAIATTLFVLFWVALLLVYFYRRFYRRVPGVDQRFPLAPDTNQLYYGDSHLREYPVFDKAE